MIVNSEDFAFLSILSDLGILLEISKFRLFGNDPYQMNAEQFKRNDQGFITIHLLHNESP